MIKLPSVGDISPDKRLMVKDKFNKYYGGFINNDIDEEVQVPIKPKKKSKWS